MDAFLWTLAAAAVTGAVFLAYQHPASYARVVTGPINIAYLFASIALAANIFGFNNGREGIMSLWTDIPEGKVEAVAAVNTNGVFTIGLLCMCIWVFLMLLLLLPRLGFSKDSRE